VISATFEVRVAARNIAATDIVSFELVDPAGGPLPPFSAGSHIDVHVADGLVRQYSLCNHPAETHRYQIGVLHDAASRGGSRGLHERLQAGDLIRISAPKNHFPLAAGARHSMLFAGGIGITPILCMAERLAASGASFAMHYCARSRDRAAFLERIAAAPFADRVRLHFDDEGAEQRLDLHATLAEPAEGVHLYVCGPKGFMDATLATARAAGWPEDRLHYEFFSADVAPRDADEAFEVKLASSGRSVVVPRDQTVIQALAAAGVDLPSSCEQGVCGTCLTRVIDGIPDHRDLFLTREEQALNDQFTPCCSRAKSHVLVLDI